MTEFPERINAGDFELVRRQPSFENATVMFQLLDAERPRFEQWLGWVSDTKSPEDCYNWIKLADAEGVGMYFIKNGGKVLGSVGFNKKIEVAKQLHLGYWLTSEAEGQGIITAAIKLLEAEAFSRGWEIIRIGCDVLNEKSRRVAERLGYIYEGTLRHEEPYADGRRYDNAFYSKLRTEWEAGQK